MAVRAGKVDCYLSECLRCHAINKECDKSDGASDECLSVKGKHTSNRRKVGLLEHGSFVTFFLEQMGHFVTNSIWVSVCLKNVCVWFADFLCIYCLQLPGLFVSKRLSDFVVKDSLMPSCVTVFLYINNVCMRGLCVCVCVCVCVCTRIVFNQVFFFLSFLQVYVPRRYAPGNSADSALGFWTLSVFSWLRRRGGTLPSRAVPSCAVLCLTQCPWLTNTKWRGSGWTGSVKVKVLKVALVRTCPLCLFVFFFFLPPNTEVPLTFCYTNTSW